jgi:sensor histidine kinase regulating citrate/malate metabolism
MKKSVKSVHPCLAGRQVCKSPDWIGTSVIQTGYIIVKAHGGTISVESKENMGTEFIIKIPLKS